MGAFYAVLCTFVCIGKIPLLEKKKIKERKKSYGILDLKMSISNPTVNPYISRKEKVRPNRAK